MDQSGRGGVLVRRRLDLCVARVACFVPASRSALPRSEIPNKQSGECMYANKACFQRSRVVTVDCLVRSVPVEVAEN
jgi:hypothetical protein